MILGYPLFYHYYDRRDRLHYDIHVKNNEEEINTRGCPYLIGQPLFVRRFFIEKVTKEINFHAIISLMLEYLFLHIQLLLVAHIIYMQVPIRVYKAP